MNIWLIERIPTNIYMKYLLSTHVFRALSQPSLMFFGLFSLGVEESKKKNYKIFVTSELMEKEFFMLFF